MITGGIMSGLGVLLTPFTAGGSLAVSALTLTGSALSLSGAFATLFGTNPQKVIDEAVREMQDLKRDGNAIANLLLLYMISHEDLEKFIGNNKNYAKMVAHYLSHFLILGVW